MNAICVFFSSTLVVIIKAAAATTTIMNIYKLPKLCVAVVIRSDAQLVYALQLIRCTEPEPDSLQPTV